MGKKFAVYQFKTFSQHLETLLDVASVYGKTVASPFRDIVISLKVGMVTALYTNLLVIKCLLS